jgi:hypothetical protein
MCELKSAQLDLCPSTPKNEQTDWTREIDINSPFSYPCQQDTIFTGKTSPWKNETMDFFSGCDGCEKTLSLQEKIFTPASKRDMRKMYSRLFQYVSFNGRKNKRKRIRGLLFEETASRENLSQLQMPLTPLNKENVELPLNNSVLQLRTLFTSDRENTSIKSLLPTVSNDVTSFFNKKSHVEQNIRSDSPEGKQSQDTPFSLSISTRTVPSSQ